LNRSRRRRRGSRSVRSRCPGKDRPNNVVITNSARVTPGTTGPAGPTGGLSTAAPHVGRGVVTFSNLGIGGTVGT
jgi:hypothetical protein